MLCTVRHNRHSNLPKWFRRRYGFYKSERFPICSHSRNIRSFLCQFDKSVSSLNLQLLARNTTCACSSFFSVVKIHAAKNKKTIEQKFLNSFLSYQKLCHNCVFINKQTFVHSFIHSYRRSDIPVVR